MRDRVGKLIDYHQANQGKNGISRQDDIANMYNHFIFSVISAPIFVIPAKAGIPLSLATSVSQRSAKRALYSLDSRPCSSQGQALRGNG